MIFNILDLVFTKPVSFTNYKHCMKYLRKYVSKMKNIWPRASLQPCMWRNVKSLIYPKWNQIFLSCVWNVIMTVTSIIHTDQYWRFGLLLLLKWPNFNYAAKLIWWNLINNHSVTLQQNVDFLTDYIQGICHLCSKLLKFYLNNFFFFKLLQYLQKDFNILTAA